MRLLALLVVAVSALTCDGAGTPPGEVSTEGTAPGSTWLPEPTRVALLGEADGLVLFDVVSVLAVDDGVVIVQGTPPRILLADLQGDIRAEAGRSGDGPGEFREIVSAAVIGSDSLFVFDRAARRVSIFDPALRFARSFQLIGDEQPALGDAAPALGGYVASHQAHFVPGTLAPGPHRAPSKLLLFGPDGRFDRPVADLPGAEIRVGENGGFVLPLLPRQSVWAAGNDIVFIGTGDDQTVWAIERQGSPREHLQVGREQVALSHLDKAAIVDTLAARAPETRRNRVRRTAETSPLPDVLPPFGAMVVDDEGNLWISEYPDPRVPSTGWTVFDRNARVVAELSLPSLFRPTDIRGGMAYGVLEDELGREGVAVYQVKR